MSHLINSGWEIYQDNQYTIGSPQSITVNTQTKLTCNGLGALTDTTQKTGGITPLWDVTTSLAKHQVPGQLTSYRIFFNIIPTTADKTLSIKIRQVGGSIFFVNDTIRLSKGAGVTHMITRWYPIYADAGTVANSMEFFMESDSATTLWGTTVLCMVEHLPRFGS